MGAPLETRPHEKKNECTRDKQRAGKQAGQSLAHPIKKLTPEKLTHQRATKDERETKLYAPVFFVPHRCPSVSPPLLDNKKHVKNLSKNERSIKNKTLFKAQGWEKGRELQEWSGKCQRKSRIPWSGENGIKITNVIIKI